jgi:hypothetical protein
MKMPEMVAGGSVQVISRKSRTPIRQDPNKLTTREVRLHVTFRQAEAFQGRVKQRARAVEDELSFYANVQFASVLFELPSVQAAAVCGQAKIDAVVSGEFLRRTRLLPVREVGETGLGA